MVYCSSCGTANRDGSSFCNDCGAKLPSGTSVRCPQCGTPNSLVDTFCEKCGARLVPTLADDAPEPESLAVPIKKGLSLPTKPAIDASPAPADWLGQLRLSLDSAADAEPASPEDTLVPQPAAAPQPAAGEVPDWLTSLGIISSDNPPLASKADEDVPEWLSQLPLNAAESMENSGTPAAAAEPSDPADWLRNLRAVAPAEPASSADDEDIPEWLRTLGTGPLASSQPDQPAAPASSPAGLVRLEPATEDEEDIPDWLRTLGTGPLPSAAVESATSESTPSTSAGPIEPEDSADWLTNLRAAAPTPEPESMAEVALAENLPADQPAAPDELPEWLRNLGTADHTQHSTDELPDWLDSLGTETPATEAPAAEAETPAEDDVSAWLRDLGASAVTPSAETPSTELSTGESSDWMGALRATASQPTESAESISEPAAEEEVPDWLQSIGLPASEPTPAPAADETPDWMSSLRATASQPTESAESISEPAAEEEVPDWLQAMGLPASEPTSAPAADETPDWMSSLRATASEPTESAESISEPATEEEVPDWLQSMGLPASEPTPAPAADETPDWMSSLRATASQPTESAEPISEPATEEEVPDWLQSMGLPASEPTPAPAADETPDWMSSLRATASQPTESAEPISEPAAEEEVPDWLQAMGLPASEPTPAPATDETPDWMSSLRATASQPTESAESISEPATEEEVPDWLQAMGLPASEPTPAPAADETPDWMSSLRATASEPTESTEPISEPAAEEVPDWLRSFDKPVSGAIPETPVSPSTADDVPDWLRDVGAGAAAQPAKAEASALPDWLQDTSAATEPEPASSIEPAAELPDWLSDLQPQASPTASVPARPEQPAVRSRILSDVETQVGNAGPQSIDETAVGAELPEWLKSLRQGKVAAPIQPVEPLPGLIQAEIPSWLEALRPKEGQAATVADFPAESEQEGVFAGLSNVLPPMPGLDELPAPIPHEITGPSADDLARAGIFQELLTRPISRPTAVAALTTSSRPAQHRLLQWAIALLLVAVVVAPFLMPQGWLPFLPHADNLPPLPLVQSAVTEISTLPPHASVLVVFDYDPTQAGEMDQIAEMVLRHLQTRAANITAVSLNPLGAGLAHSVWDVIGAPTGGQRIDKGYVPGQAIGVQSVLLNNGPFDLVIDLSASSDSLRWWVEQIAVSNLKTPLIAGVSAAVESLARPYAQSGQIAGLISGATGAMMYARQANLLPSLDEARLGRNQYHIESQTLAHWLLAILIVIGLVSGLVSRAGRRSAS